jgi:hypothetical protein
MRCPVLPSAASSVAACTPAARGSRRVRTDRPLYTTALDCRGRQAAAGAGDRGGEGSGRGGLVVRGSSRACTPRVATELHSRRFTQPQCGPPHPTVPRALPPLAPPSPPAATPLLPPRATAAAAASAAQRLAPLPPFQPRPHPLHRCMQPTLPPEPRLGGEFFEIFFVRFSFLLLLSKYKQCRKKQKCGRQVMKL